MTQIWAFYKGPSMETHSEMLQYSAPEQKSVNCIIIHIRLLLEIINDNIIF